MLYFHLTQSGAVDAISAKYPRESHPTEWDTRNDWPTMDHARRVAEAATVFAGALYIAIDSGPNVSPRFDVIKAPAIGDEVSYSFNGDTTPDGTIAGMSSNLRVIRTSTGRVYYRRGESGRWVRHGTWALIPGHINERNPSF